MTKQEFLNNKYQSLCQQLGDAELKAAQLADHISDIKSKIQALNELYPILSEFEATIKSSKPSQKLSNNPLESSND